MMMIPRLRKITTKEYKEDNMNNEYYISTTKTTTIDNILLIIENK